MEASASLSIGPTPTLGVAALTVYDGGAWAVCSSKIAAYRRQAGSDRCVWVDASSCPESELGVWAAEGFENVCPNFDFSESHRSDFVEGAKGSRTPKITTFCGVGLLPPTLLGAGLSGDTALARFHVCRADGTLFGGAGGFADLWHVMPRLKRAGRIALLRLFSGLLDTAYSVFLRVRPLWQSTRTAPTSKEQT